MADPQDVGTTFLKAHPSLNIYPGLVGASTAEELNQVDRFKVAVAGRVKTGKSWFAVTMPGTKFVADFDDRKASIAGKPNVVVKTYKDTLQGKPGAWEAFSSDIKNFEYLKTQGKPIPEVYIMDSMTHAVKVIENQLIKSMSNLSRTITCGTEKLIVPSGWDVTTAVRNVLENMISRLSELGHVICIFHEEPEKDKTKSSPSEPVYTGQYVVHPFYLRTLLSTFNETYRLEIKNGEFLLTCKPTGEFGASTTMLIDRNEKPDFTLMIEKHLKRKAELKK